MKTLKEILKKTERETFTKTDLDFFGKYLQVLDALKVTSMRPDIALKEEGIINEYKETVELGMMVWKDEISNFSIAFEKNITKKKLKYSIYCKDYEQNSAWKHEGDYNTFLEATNWLSVAVSATDNRIFEALKLAGLNK